MIHGKIRMGQKTPVLGSKKFTPQLWLLFETSCSDSIAVAFEFSLYREERLVLFLLLCRHRCLSARHGAWARAGTSSSPPSRGKLLARRADILRVSSDVAAL